MKYIIKEIDTPIRIEELIELIGERIMINGRVNPYITRKSSEVIIEESLDYILDSIYYYTSFLDDDTSLSNRVRLLLSGVVGSKKCECGNDIIKPKIRSGKVIGLNDYCSQSCANTYTNKKRGSEFYKNVSKKIVKTRIENNSYIPTDAFKYCMRDPKIRAKAKKTNLKKYGVENPGVLGAYSSKAAENFIRGFINENGINEDVCYFKNGGVNNQEFYQSVLDEKTNKHLFLSYDLVVFGSIKSAKEKDLNSIVLVLEYNGPWHYKTEYALEHPKEPATPYPNSKTILETYEYDIFKMNHIKKYCDNFLVYWYKDEKFGDY